MLGVLALHLRDGDAHGQLGEIGQELVQRRVEQPDGDGQAVHRLEDAHEILALQGKQRVEGPLPGVVTLGEDQVLDQLAALAEKHVLGAAQADALRAEPPGPLGVLGVVGVGAHLQPAARVGMRDDAVNGGDERVGVGRQRALEVLHHRRWLHRHLAEKYVAGRAVDGDDVTFVDDDASGSRELLAADVDVEAVCAADTGLAHAPCHDGGVRRLAAAAGQDALRRDHAVQVVGIGLPAHQDDPLPSRCKGFHPVRVEDRLAHGRAGTGVHALGDLPPVGLLIERREHQLGELRAGHPRDRLVEIDHAFVDQLACDHKCGCGGALTDSGLEHPQLVALDGELDVAQVAVVALERRHDLHQLVVGRLVDALEFGQREGVANAGDDVLALRVLQVVAVDALRSGRGVAREGDPGSRVHAGIAEDHRDDVDRRTEIGRNPFLAAVEDRAGSVPGVEDGADGEVHLFTWLLREVATGVLVHDLLEGGDKLLEVAGVQIEVVRRALGLLGGVDRVLEVLAVDVQHGLAEHLDQPAVGIPGEAVVSGLGGEALHRGVVQADIEDGLHHAGHRELRAGPHGDQQRVVCLPQGLAHRLLQGDQVGADLGGQLRRFLATGQVLLTRRRGDDETGRYRQAEVGHLGEVGALATEQVLHVLVALGEAVHVLRHAASLSTATPKPTGPREIRIHHRVGPILRW